MKTAIKIILIFIILVLLLICWTQLNQLLLKIPLSLAILFIGWAVYEIQRETTMPDRFDNFGGGTWGDKNKPK